MTHDSLIVEMTGSLEKITAFIDLMETFGVKELTRTGILRFLEDEV